MSHAKDVASPQRRNFLKFIGKIGLSMPLLQASSLGAGMLLSLLAPMGAFWAARRRRG